MNWVYFRLTADKIAQIFGVRKHRRIRGIKIQDIRMMRLMEVLLHGGSQLAGWRTAPIHDPSRQPLDSRRRLTL